MHDVELRDCLADIIGEINQPLELANYECMKLLADVLRFVMTLFVHEQLTDYKLLYMILQICQLVYFTASKKRKVHLSSLILDHGIWSDSSNWRDTIEYMIKLKLEDAYRRKKIKAQLDAQNHSKHGRSSGDSNIFKKSFKGLKNLIKSKDEKT